MKKDRLQMIEEMLHSNPDDPFLNYAAALELKKSGNVLKSIEIIETLLNKEPGYLGGYYQLGKFYEEINQPAKAIEIYKKGKIVAQQQNDNKTTNELSEALMMLED